jgi:ABC-type transport system substrate-binding protein
MAATSSRDKILRIGILNLAQNLDPRTAQDTDSMFVVKQIYESPYWIRYGSTEIEPLLLEGEAVEESPIRWRAKVRRDVYFSDGTPMTAADVARSLNDAGAVADQARVEAEGNSLVFHLEQPNARFALSLAHGQCGVTKRDGDRLLGTGPFVLHEDSEPGFVRLVRNSHHRPLARLDEVHFRTYPLDKAGQPKALLKAIEEGQVDLSSSLGRDAINALTGMRKSIQPGISTCFLFMNVQSPLLGDARLRQAIAHAIDRFELAKLCYSNALAFVAGSPLPRALGSCEDRLGFDLAKARGLFAAAGSPKLRLRLLVIWGPRPYLPAPRPVADALVAMLYALGIEVEVQTTASSKEFFEQLVKADYDLTLAGWVADTMDPVEYLEALLASYRIPSWENLAVSANESRFSDPRLDALLHRWRIQSGGQTLEEIVDLVNEEAPLVPLIYGASATVYSFRTRELKTSPLAHFPLTEVDVD